MATGSAATLLIGDIGGTNARFALADRDRAGFRDERIFACDDFNSPEGAVEAYLTAVGAPAPTVICFAVAGPIVDNSVRFTNNTWHIAVSSLAATFRCEMVHLLNDFEAIALSLPAVDPGQAQAIGTVPAGSLDLPDFSICVMGPGTGLGAAGLLRRSGMDLPVVSEAGHVGFAPESPLQVEILKALQSRYRRVSDERLVSGMGIENIYWALGQIGDLQLAPTSDARIFELAEDGRDPIAAQATDLFFEILGQVTGNFVLSLGAFDGAYIAGGIAQRHAGLLAASRFREGFESKGRHQSLLARVPSCLVTHPQPGLLGAAEVARRLIAIQPG